MANALWMYEIGELVQLERQTKRAATAAHLHRASQPVDWLAPTRSTAAALQPLSAPLPLALLGLVIARRHVLAGSSKQPAGSLPFLGKRAVLPRKLQAALRWLRLSLRGVF